MKKQTQLEQNKKSYTAPKMDVVELNHRMNLMTCSSTDPHCIHGELQ